MEVGLFIAVFVPLFGLGSNVLDVFFHHRGAVIVASILLFIIVVTASLLVARIISQRIFR